MRHVAPARAGTLHGLPFVAGRGGDSSAAPPPPEGAAAKTIPNRSSIAVYGTVQPASRYHRAAGEPLHRLAGHRWRATSEWRDPAGRWASCPVGLAPAAPSPVVL